MAQRLKRPDQAIYVPRHKRASVEKSVVEDEKSAVVNESCECGTDPSDKTNERSPRTKKRQGAGSPSTRHARTRRNENENIEVLSKNSSKKQQECDVKQRHKSEQSDSVDYVPADDSNHISINHPTTMSRPAYDDNVLSSSNDFLAVVNCKNEPLSDQCSGLEPANVDEIIAGDNFHFKELAGSVTDNGQLEEENSHLDTSIGAASEEKCQGSDDLLERQKESTCNFANNL